MVLAVPVVLVAVALGSLSLVDWVAAASRWWCCR
jgi:hypothetical protein